MTAGPLRLRRIVNPKTGRALLLSFTAGLEVGVVPGLAELPETIGAFAKTGLLTGAIVHAGVPPSLFARVPDLACGLVVDLFGGTWMTARPERREQICHLEHAVRVGADAVLATVALGSADESLHLRLCGQIVREADSWGLPVVVRVDTTQTDARRQYSATIAGHGARLAYELGADVVVVNFADSGPAFAEMVRGVTIPVLIGGGPHMDTDEALLDSAAQAMRHGASGVALAAPLFWQDGPSETFTRLADIVYA
jgi:DhnA family fructose-bisphosphate aldolase class Ia